MVNELNIVNVLVNGGVVAGFAGATIFLLKKWMDKRETEETKIGNESKSDLQELKKDFKDQLNSVAGKIGDNRKYYSQTYEDLKIQIRENKDFYQVTADEIKERIQQLSDYQREANGRTGKLEVSLNAHIAVCQERNREIIAEGGERRFGCGRRKEDVKTIGE